MPSLPTAGTFRRLTHRAMVRLPWRIAVYRRKRSGDFIVRILETELSTGGRFLDIGANRGDYAALGSDRVGPAGLVVAVEPGITHRVRLARWAGDAEGRLFIPAAVDSTPGLMAMSVPIDADGNAMHWLATGREQLTNSRQEVAPVVNVDAIWDHVGPFDLVKIDVEGLESRVLKGMTACLSEVRTLIVEIEARHCGESGVRDTLATLGREFPLSFFIRDQRLVDLREFDVTSDQTGLLSASNYTGENFRSDRLPSRYVSDFVFTRDESALASLI